MRHVEKDVALVRLVAMVIFVRVIALVGLHDRTVERSRDHVEAVQSVSPAGVRVVLPIGDSVTNEEALQGNLSAVDNSLLSVVSVDLPREIRYVNTTIRLTGYEQVAVLVLRE